MKLVRVEPSHMKEKKYDAILEDDKGKKHIVAFGAKGYEDFTTYSHDSKTEANLRKFAYIKRHEAREDWGKSGILTPGFWARWVLWNQPTLRESVADVRRRFDL